MGVGDTKSKRGGEEGGAVAKVGDKRQVSEMLLLFSATIQDRLTPMTSHHTLTIFQMQNICSPSASSDVDLQRRVSGVVG